MIIKRHITFPAFTGKEKRRLYIYLPIGYEYDEEMRYPVLYMFDGHNVFYDGDATYGKSWGVGNYLDRTQIPLIVVALECHHGTHHERLSEYSPYSFKEKGVGSFVGRGDQTMNYFITKLKPMIDKNYRTIKDREHTFIAGSSMGGLMALYAALRYNDVYGKAAALSPAIFLCYKNVCNLVKKTKAGMDTTIYMDMGSEEMTYEGGSVEGYSDFGKMIMDKNIALTMRVVPGGDHSEASWERQLAIFIDTLMYGT